MATRKKKKSPLKGIALYNKILKEFSSLNELLPVEKQLPLIKRRQIVSEVLYPSYKNLPLKERTLKNIRVDIQNVVNDFPPEQTCHPLYFPDSQLTLIDYFAIDEFIRNYLPDCFDIRINAGEFGITPIFSTARYSYFSSGVRDIVENIRQEIAKNKSGVAFFEGIKKLKPKKENNLKPENYFIDFVLLIYDRLVDEEDGVSYKLPKKSKAIKKKILSDVEKKMKGLIKEKAKKKREVQKQKDKVKLRNSVKNAKKKSQEYTRQSSINKAVDDAMKTLLTAYKKKAITKAQYDKQKKSLLKLKK
jgi:hypothetical protein